MGRTASPSADRVEARLAAAAIVVVGDGGRGSEGREGEHTFENEGDRLCQSERECDRMSKMRACVCVDRERGGGGEREKEKERDMHTHPCACRYIGRMQLCGRYFAMLLR